MVVIMIATVVLTIVMTSMEFVMDAQVIVRKLGKDVISVTNAVVTIAITSTAHVTNVNIVCFYSALLVMILYFAHFATTHL